MRARRHRRVSRAPAWGVLLTLGVLAGCSTFGDEAVRLPCPDYRIPAEAATLVKFRDGPGRDLTDVEHQGRIVTVRLACRHEIDEDTGTGTLEVAISPVIAVERGPADTDRQATYPFFIAVTDTQQNILFRERLTQPVEFQGNRTRQALGAGTSTLEIPLAKDKRGPDYVIYLGFDLTREQVAYNRKQIEDSRR